MLVLVTAHKSRHLELVHTLLGYGIFTYVTTPDAAQAVCRDKDTGGVVLDCVGMLTAGEALCRALRAEYPLLPIAAMVAADAVPNMEIHALLREGDPARLTADLLDFCQRTCGWRTSVLSTFSLTVTNAPEETVYMGYRMPLSAREHTVLRCLFYRSPSYTTADDLLALCYPQGHQRAANLTVQICNINRRAARIDPRPLIVNHRGRGYRLRYGIVPLPPEEPPLLSQKGDTP